jgi:arylsulfatase A-like enzyme
VDGADVSPTHRRSFEGRPWYHQASLETKPKIQDPGELKWRTEGSRTGPLDDRQLAKMTANYFGMISLIDHNVGRIRSVLDDLGYGEETLIVYTSDHGDLLGDHGLYQKGPTPYEGLLTVGAVAAGPGIPAGRIVRDPTSTLDLNATFLDYAGADPVNDAQSRSLRPLLEGVPGASRDMALSEWRLLPFRTGIELDLRTVRTARHKLSLDLLSGAGELYDLADDPTESANRFDDPGMAAVQKELTEMIRARPGPMIETLPEPSAPGGS